jgi:serine/threonine protein kinase
LVVNDNATNPGGPARAAMPNSENPPPPIPDHQLLRRIGRGSYGEVWLAQSATGAYRAVKIVRRPDAEDEDGSYDREFNGVRTVEPISREHDAVVDVLHVGRIDDGRCFYYVMELADDLETGQAIDPDHYQPRTLRGELRRRGRLPVAECLDVATALASALDHLHRKGLVHRDVKPSNVIYVNGRPKLADIGLVTGAGDSGSFVGTLGCVAPEGPRGPQADIYSFGKVLYEIATGKDRQEYPELPTDRGSRGGRGGLVRRRRPRAEAPQFRPVPALVPPGHASARRGTQADRDRRRGLCLAILPPARG